MLDVWNHRHDGIDSATEHDDSLLRSILAILQMHEVDSAEGWRMFSAGDKKWREDKLQAVLGWLGLETSQVDFHQQLVNISEAHSKPQEISRQLGFGRVYGS